LPDELQALAGSTDASEGDPSAPSSEAINNRQVWLVWLEAALELALGELLGDE
jgi:hypothetical protein